VLGALRPIQNALRGNPTNPTCAYLTCALSKLATDRASPWSSTNTSSARTAAPYRTWRAHRRPFHDQISQWPQRLDRWRCPFSLAPKTLKDLFLQRSAGSGLAPMDVPVSRAKNARRRMLPTQCNGHRCARHLDAHPKVKRWPLSRLPTHPRHDIARKQQRSGAMLAFDLGSRTPPRF